MNGPSARALREGGVGGSLPYKQGFALAIRVVSGGPLPSDWKKKTTLQSIFGDYGQIIRIDVNESQGAAFIEYDDRRDAEDAREHMDGKKIGGKAVSIQIAGAEKLRAPSRIIDIEERIAEMARKYRLDEAATARLVSVFAERSRLGCDLNRDCDDLAEHLAASNKPSALVSMKLADLRAGRPIGPCKYSKSGRESDAGQGWATANRSSTSRPGRDEGRGREDRDRRRSPHRTSGDRDQEGGGRRREISRTHDGRGAWRSGDEEREHRRRREDSEEDVSGRKRHRGERD